MRSLVLPAVWVIATVIVAAQLMRAGVLWSVFLVPLVLVDLLVLPFFVRMYWRALRGLPFLTLDADGVTSHATRLRLAWSDVAEVRVVPSARRDTMIAFVPVDPQRAMEGLGWWRRRLAGDGMRRVGGHVFAPAEGLAAPIEDVLAAARRFTPARIRHEYRL